MAGLNSLCLVSVRSLSSWAPTHAALTFDHCSQAVQPPSPTKAPSGRGLAGFRRGGGSQGSVFPAGITLAGLVMTCKRSEERGCRALEGLKAQLGDRILASVPDQEYQKEPQSFPHGTATVQMSLPSFYNAVKHPTAQCFTQPRSSFPIPGTFARRLREASSDEFASPVFSYLASFTFSRGSGAPPHHPWRGRGRGR